jgi:hypothetical protein
MVKGWARCALVIQAVLAAASGCDSDDGSAGAGGEAGTSLTGGAAGEGAAGRCGSVAAGASGNAGTSGETGGAAGTPAGDAGADSRAGSPAAGEGGEAGEGGSAGSASGASGTGDAGASGSAGGGPIVPITEPVSIITDDHGRVTPESNGIGISGNWYAENDCVTSPGDCTTDHVIGPILGEVPFDTRPYPTDDGKVCMKGVTASVNADPEYATKWGARWVLPLNQGPNGEHRPYDAIARGIAAFSVGFELRGADMADSSVRIALLVDGVADTHSRQFFGITSLNSSFAAEFTRVKQANDADPFRVFDGSRITAIEITLMTRKGYALPFDLCIRDLIAIPATLFEPDLSAAPEIPEGTHLVPLHANPDGTLQPNAAFREPGTPKTTAPPLPTTAPPITRPPRATPSRSPTTAPAPPASSSPSAPAPNTPRNGAQRSACTSTARTRALRRNPSTPSPRASSASPTRSARAPTSRCASKPSRKASRNRTSVRSRSRPSTALHGTTFTKATG